MSILQPNNQLFNWHRASLKKESFYEKLNAIIKENASDPYFGVEQLANILSLNNSSLVKECFESTGDRPCKYILKIRLSRAAELLKSTNEPLQNVAWDSGFLSYSGFWRAFGAMYAHTPSSYRSLYQEGNKTIKFTWRISTCFAERASLARLIDYKPLIGFVFKVLKDNIQNENFTLGILAETMDTSSSQLTRKLKSNMGVTPMRLLQHLRLLQAAHYLSDESKSIVEIANQTGFFDQAHLCRKFKVIYNCSPLAFRKSGRRDEFILWLESHLANK